MRCLGDALVSCNGGGQLSRANRAGSTLPKRRCSRAVVTASASPPSPPGDPSEEKDFFLENARLIRLAPVLVGTLSFLSIAANKVQVRVQSSVTTRERLSFMSAPVVECCCFEQSIKEANNGGRRRVQGASRAQQRRLQLAAEGSQSRADVLAIANSATSVLTGLVWLSLR